ncbi:sugar ABC transporter ATP-binding protein [Alkalihalophilus lindianensis]|uniref:Sugar ABC transporter ATP-binding protein n=1 Tax=Alkalihalophilus lindianensis TaxID=1630542 RepID=A0ABU3X972_9BACI|nr:sugar ABC transporter ATP-binding protein [Alkalihalophilus lindianensis]MDV2684439.1 sugar ABC transporter ATP-binding protein [Alkalihalophilus lindianensis]
MGHLLEMRDIKKSFSSIKVLKGINFSVKAGEIVALLGENGAGKSTLMKILAGVHEPTDGKIFLNDKEVSIDGPKHSQELGISIIHQEFNLIPDLTVAENIFLGREQQGVRGIISWKAMHTETNELLKKVGLKNVSPTQLIADCSVAQRQLIEIAKALSFESDVLIMDEPTATLNNEDTQTLLNLMKALSDEGLGIIFITHRLEEVVKVADRIVVLRDGEYIGSELVANVTKDDMVTMMVGRDITDLFPERTTPQEEVVLEVADLSVRNRLYDVSFKVKKGEILGVAGLLGSGKTDLSKALFGLHKRQSGSISMLGQDVETPKEAIDAGIALVTDDRKSEGVILDLSVYENLLMPFYRRISKTGILNKTKMDQIVDKWINDLKIKVHEPHVEVRTLSGGNQQKVVLGKWLQMNPKLLILNEPTRGIDIGAKTEIYKIMKDLTNEGIAIILISSEMPELLGMANRIAVMHEGRISGELPIEEATQEKIFYYATGGDTHGKTS